MIKTKNENKDPNANKGMNEIYRKKFTCLKGGFYEEAV